MFITVLHGEGRADLFNLDCRIMNFIHSLKERCQVDPQDHVDLINKCGELMGLPESEQSVESACTLLRERQTYILMLANGSSEGAEVQRYVPLLADVDRMHPELADVVRKLSNPSKENDKKPGAPRRGLQTHSRNRPNASVKKNVSTPRS
ncbi:uncharacterized protein LOC121714975 isoform X1 [Alosa sapidissima]|uniref:uncharacterized protein LOC121714975 isoform X1 n=2 Tax=Alosa sapidissima TaxID=34773 RepID=UPI001C0A3A3D|nr:uncharacterized protein LOC121714975 isoform X1 [Alosa sapidissima]